MYPIFESGRMISHAISKSISFEQLLFVNSAANHQKSSSYGKNYNNRKQNIYRA
jgi:hypothetical protein